VTAGFAIASATAAAAFAGSSSALLQQYGGLAGETQRVIPVSTHAVRTSGALPFTGLDLALIAVGGILLLLAGWALRRAGRNKT
jgi:hypothetical protein